MIRFLSVGVLAAGVSLYLLKTRRGAKEVLSMADYEVKIVLTLKNNVLENFEVTGSKGKRDLTNEEAAEIESKAGFRHITDIYFARMNPCYYIYRQGARLIKEEVDCPPT